VPLPVAHGIIGASVVAASRTNVTLGRDWKVILLGAALAICPDFDIFFIWAFNLNGDLHRSVSHSILFAAAAGLIASILFGRAQLKDVVVLASATLSHSLADILSSKMALGVRLLWPLPHRFRLGLCDYFAPLIDPRYTSVAVFLTRLFLVSLAELALFTPVFIAALLIGQASSKAFDEL